MQEMIEFESEYNPGARIKVVGVGGGGTNAVDSMVESGLRGVEFYIVNTDVQVLARSKVSTKIQIGRELTHGRGAGADPHVGEKAAQEAQDLISDALKGADMVFITAGLGGGTGTGAAPVVAEIAKSLGILTVAVVTRPFRFEGPQRMRRANEGLDKLRNFVDTCIIVSNDRLLEVAGPKATLKEAFSVANDVLRMGVSSISELIGTPGLINVDFSDVRAIMNETGGAVMGVGVGKGENRASEAVKKATSSPLLDKVVIDGARGVLMCVTGGPDMTLSQINEATMMVYQAASPEANIIFGAVIDDRMQDELRVTIIATGFDEKTNEGEMRLSPDDLRATASSSLKDKVKSVFSPAAERPAPVAAEPVAPRQVAEAAKSVPGSVEATPTARPAVASAKPEAPEARSAGDFVDFNRSNNPLRSGGMFVDEEGSDNPAAAQPAQPAAEPSEDDLETPPFLKRRRRLFE